MSDELLPFPLQLQPGLPISEQVVYAVKKAMISGLLKPGHRFPSVRAMSKELRIHPNTAQKAIAALVKEGFLLVHPGIGTVVGGETAAPSKRDLELLENDVERLVVDAKNKQLNLNDFQHMIEQQWNRLSTSP